MFKRKWATEAYNPDGSRMEITRKFWFKYSADNHCLALNNWARALRSPNRARVIEL